jgi:alkanesulfonate monooxygenase SsuD/methylene tetrahydromethanopterin reductase-like flavin-dependent oxidoreductase (luciferase family)
MQVGIFLFTAQFEGMTHGEVLTAALDYATTAERCGYREAWITEHHFIPYGICPSAATMASFLLGRTTRLRIGTAVSLLPLHHPVPLAEQTALLDHLSGGRFCLGVGRGGPVVDLEVFGSSLVRYERGLPESVDLILQTWTQASVAANSEFFQFRSVPANPRPLTQPHPPLYVACHSGNRVEVAARRGLPMLLFFHFDNDAKASLLERYGEIAERHGHDPAKIDHAWAMMGYIADNQEQARQELRRTLLPWYEASGKAYIYLQPQQGHPDLELPLESMFVHHPIGTPEDCLEKLTVTMERTGLRHVLVMLEAPAERQQTLENIERFATEVLAKLPRVAGD